jgi:uncharacterized protein YjbJ (UPF0337 family)
MSTKGTPAEDDTGNTKEAAGPVAGNGDIEKQGLTDQDRAEMKESLENAGYKVKDAVSD